MKREEAELLAVGIIIALDLLLPLWLAALIVTVVLFGGAGALALLGKNQVQEATPLQPERAVAGIQKDIATVKGQRA